MQVPLLLAADVLPISSQGQKLPKKDASHVVQTGFKLTMYWP